MFLIPFIAFSLLAAEALDFDMTPDEKKKTGINKLSDKEKASLQNWIDNNYAKRNQPIQKGVVERGTLQENLKSGRYLRLSDGSIWNIHPGDISVTQGWITPVDIIVTQSSDSNYPYKLTNSVTGSSVRAKKVESIPASPPMPPAPQTAPKH
ncbi:MAG: hypothetical protein V4487_08825 [Chlamydiota bacterium]